MAVRARATDRAVRSDGDLQLWVPQWRDRGMFLAATRASVDLHRDWVAPPRRELGYRRFLALHDGERNQGYLLWSAEAAAMVGFVALAPITRTRERRSAVLGYWGVAGHDRRGYVTRGVALALEHAFRRLRLQRVEANIRPDNTASLAVVRRLGFAYEGCVRAYARFRGIWHDHERWAVTRESWCGSAGSPVDEERRR